MALGERERWKGERGRGGGRKNEREGKGEIVEEEKKMAAKGEGLGKKNRINVACAYVAL